SSFVHYRFVYYFSGDRLSLPPFPTRRSSDLMAVQEAQRCLQCKNHPCRSGCPVDIDIPGFIAHVAKGEFEEAYKVIAQSSALPAVCGRVCPQENQCEGKCIRGIKGEPVGIGRLERFVADWYRENVHARPE